MNAQELYIFILNSNIINFILMILILRWIFKKFQLGKIIDSMADDIKNGVITSAEIVQNAINEYKKVRKNSKNIPAQKQAIINEAIELSKKLEEKNEVDIKIKKKELDNNAKKIQKMHLKRKIQKTTDEVKNIVYEISKDTIKDIMTPEMQQKIIIDCLNELDGVVK